MQNSCFFSRVFFAAFLLNFIIALSGQQVHTNVCVDCSPFVTGKCKFAKDGQIGRSGTQDEILEALKEDELADSALEKCVPPGYKLDGKLVQSICMPDKIMGCLLAMNRSLITTQAKKDCEWCYEQCGCKNLLKSQTKPPTTTKKSESEKSAAIKSVVLASCMALTYISLALYDVINKVF